MLLGQIIQSIGSWNKLSAIHMRPKLAYKILRYTKLVSHENEIALKQRDSLIKSITSSGGIQPSTPEWDKFAPQYQELVATESSLAQIDMNFSDVIEAVDERDETLTVQDLAFLELFFSDYVASCGYECEEDTCCDK